MKTCTKCKIEKPKSEFHKDKQKKDGLRYECKPCNKELVASHRASNLDWDKARKAKYHVENREKNNTRRYNHRAANKDADSAYQRRYRLENHEKRAAFGRNRRAIERNAEGSHTASDVRTIFEKQRGLCANCQTKLFKSGAKKYHVDHIMPLALGGSNWPSNLQCLCPFCNLSKGAKHPDEWAAQNGGLI